MMKYRFGGQKKDRNCSYESFIPFEKEVLPISAVFSLPFQLYSTFRNKLQKKFPNTFCDLIFIVSSNNSQYKVFANLLKAD